MQQILAPVWRMLASRRLNRESSDSEPIAVVTIVSWAVEVGVFIFRYMFSRLRPWFLRSIPK